MKKIGISMRVSNAIGYDEVRDGIARDWYPLFAKIGLEHNWILLPNLAEDTVLYAKNWGIEALILSGGDDIGQDISRDTSELALLNYCVTQLLPVLGVCRGAQLIQQYFGGQVVSTDPLNHRATRHEVKVSTPLPWWQDEPSFSVNSFHTNKLASPLPDVLLGFATAGNECEGIRHKLHNIVGIMWHPERETAMSEFDLKLCHWLFA